VSKILYEFNIIWRNIMRKENESLKRKYTLQIQELRRQLVTKKAFDEDDSQREISRLKKELQFVEMQLYNSKRRTFQSKENVDSSNSNLKPTLSQKQELETENEHLQAQIDQMDAQSKSMRGAHLLGKSVSSFRGEEAGINGKSYLSSEIM